MTYRIIGDSSCDITKEMKEDWEIELVPYKIIIDGEEFIDDENLDKDKMMDKMNRSNQAVKTACPSPGDYLKAYHGEEDLFIVTISRKLSGSYNSAELAAQMVNADNPDRIIHVFDSKSASAGQVLTIMKIKECIDKGMETEEIIERVENYIEEMDTMFLLENLDNLIKNGRISKTKGLIATTLQLKPVMGSEDGEIELYENVRGSKRAFKRLVEAIGERGSNFEDKKLVISHNRNKDRAEEIKKEIEESYDFKELLIVETKGLSSSYADDKGIIISY